MIDAKKLVINYPPDFDGQTDVYVKETKTAFEFTFTQSKTVFVDHKKISEHTAWQALVQVAAAILKQNGRMRKRGTA